MKASKTLTLKKITAMPATARHSRDAVVSASLPSAETGSVPATLSPEERIRAIEIAAYESAGRRGFSNGSPEQDWLEAEIEIDRMLNEDSKRSD